MMFLRLFQMAVTALRRHGQRTLLAIIGVGIGIAAVIATAALGGGSAARVQSQINAVGDDFIWIRNGSRNLGGVRTGSGGFNTLTAGDSDALAANVPDIARCSPQLTGREQVVVGHQNWNTNWRGVYPSFFDVRRRVPSRGVLFDDYDETNRNRVAVLGQSVAMQLFPDSNPVGQQIRLRNFVYQVIGVLESKGADSAGLDRDDAVFVPFSTADELIERQPWVSDVMCSARSPEVVQRAEAQATALLRARHKLKAGDPDDFELRDPTEFFQMRAQMTDTLRMLLIGIGSVSLVVGGIGIMNIMLVSVAQRRREIGARMAVGARASDIRWQFLLEAAGIGVCGGVTGIGVGLVASWLLAAHFEAPIVVSGALIVWVTGAAIGAGLLFGYLPAHRASALDPIEALRAEA